MFPSQLAGLGPECHLCAIAWDNANSICFLILEAVSNFSTHKGLNTSTIWVLVIVSTGKSNKCSHRSKRLFCQRSFCLSGFFHVVILTAMAPSQASLKVFRCLRFSISAICSARDFRISSFGSLPSKRRSLNFSTLFRALDKLTVLQEPIPISFLFRWKLYL